ncbi:MAG TPA: extracellular solute-binding protein [Xanthobacteraceae bacterium]|nr:extracellular solute-binding protein [Xanthobacteraceae bacterium]
MKLSRRDVLKTSAAAAAGAVFAQPLKAAAPEATPVTPALIEAARREGKLAFYTALELNISEKLGKAFEAKYPGIAVRVERSGAERIFQRIGQEQDSRINAVDLVCSTDPAHFIFWKRKDWIAPYVPEEAARNLPRERIDPDGTSATVCAWFSVIGYNTDLVKREDAPTSYADLLDPKWKGKIVKGHPGYSGAILTATYQISRDLGWAYFEKLAQQRVMQVQSAAEPPRKIAAGERAVQADGNDYSLMLYRDAGRPVEVVYASEGTPQIIVETGIFRSSANPNAARLFQHFLFSAEGQQIFIDFAHRSFHAQVKDKPGRPPLSAIRTMKSDPAAVEAQSDQIKARYTKIFGV